MPQTLRREGAQEASAAPAPCGVTRVLVFTDNPDLPRTPWWRLLLATPGLRGVLVCSHVRSRAPGAVLRRFWRNVVRHGPLFIPYRAALFGRDVWRALATLEAPAHPDIPVEVIRTDRLHAPQVIERVRSWAPDLGIALGAPMLRPAIYEIPRLGTINLHLGAVPEFRGAPPGFWELHAGATSIGATVHVVDAGLDTGPVIASSRAPIYPDDTLADVQARVEELGARVFGAALRAVWDGSVPATAQPGAGRTFRFPTLTQRAMLSARIAMRRTARRCNARFAVKVGAQVMALTFVRRVRDAYRTIRGTHPVRVFTFHRVTHLCRDAMTVDPLVFRRQLRYIQRYHDVTSLADAIETVRSGRPLRRPVAAITFDDGYRSVYDHAFPAMRELGITGCCFVSTSLVGTRRRFEHDTDNPVSEHLDVMNWDELGELRRHGWEVGGHTANHRRLATCDDSEACREVESPLAILRDRAGADALPMAYPFGARADISDRDVALVRTAGYSALFSNFGGENGRGRDAYGLQRIDIGGDLPEIVWRSWVHGLSLGGVREAWERVFARVETRHAG